MRAHLGIITLGRAGDDCVRSAECVQVIVILKRLSGFPGTRIVGDTRRLPFASLARLFLGSLLLLAKDFF